MRSLHQFRTANQVRFSCLATIGSRSAPARLLQRTSGDLGAYRKRNGIVSHVGTGRPRRVAGWNRAPAASRRAARPTAGESADSSTRVHNTGWPIESRTKRTVARPRAPSLSLAECTPGLPMNCGGSVDPSWSSGSRSARQGVPDSSAVSAGGAMVVAPTCPPRAQAIAVMATAARTRKARLIR